jgi:hypothetical protein
MTNKEYAKKTQKTRNALQVTKLIPALQAKFAGLDKRR